MENKLQGNEFQEESFPIGVNKTVVKVKWWTPVVGPENISRSQVVCWTGIL